ncbi:hypothetical protein K488DRAFT_86766 [Vararia minispora EC-137]|uniref:Uncharacterized protein n=1 Tax=Vararia minispora EC-137 TaxID=1314806 RepID=A0ACB8QI12_9AGAM|nr:hypothetical protein K488DRAFT_86766 [Vararia minispora EC-137]
MATPYYNPPRFAAYLPSASRPLSLALSPQDAVPRACASHSSADAASGYGTQAPRRHRASARVCAEPPSESSARRAGMWDGAHAPFHARAGHPSAAGSVLSLRGSIAHVYLAHRMNAHVIPPSAPSRALQLYRGDCRAPRAIGAAGYTHPAPKRPSSRLQL